MRRSASKIIRNLEMRVARLEGKTANKNADLKIKFMWDGSKEKYLTLGEILDTLPKVFAFVHEDTDEDVFIDIGHGEVRISAGLDYDLESGEYRKEFSCDFCLWPALTAAGLEQDYGTASKKLASMIKSSLRGFNVSVNITKA